MKFVPTYIGVMISQFKDPYEPTRMCFLECHDCTTAQVAVSAFILEDHSDRGVEDRQEKHWKETFLSKVVENTPKPLPTGKKKRFLS